MQSGWGHEVTYKINYPKEPHLVYLLGDTELAPDSLLVRAAVRQ